MAAKHRIRYCLLFLYAMMAASTVRSVTSSCIGCVELDELTFGKIISRFQYSLIKFDIAFPYGEKHEAYSEFAKIIGSKIDELLVGLVGIKDYGEKENSALAQSYKVDENKYPVIFLFKNNSIENYVRYPEERAITTESIKQFVKDETSLYIGLDGCLQELDMLVADFVEKSDDEQLHIMEQAKEIENNLNKETDKEKAKAYVIIIKRIMEKGVDFMAEERRRLENLLQGKISDNKKRELTHRLNILQSFSVKLKSDEQKDEL